MDKKHIVFTRGAGEALMKDLGLFVYHIHGFPYVSFKNRDDAIALRDLLKEHNAHAIIKYM